MPARHISSLPSLNSPDLGAVKWQSSPEELVALGDKMFLPITTAGKLAKSTVYVIRQNIFTFYHKMLSDFSKKRGKKGFLSLIKAPEPLRGCFLLGLPLGSLKILPGEWQPAQIYMELLFKYDIPSQSEM